MTRNHGTTPARAGAAIRPDRPRTKKIPLEERNCTHFAVVFRKHQKQTVMEKNNTCTPCEQNFRDEVDHLVDEVKGYTKKDHEQKKKGSGRSVRQRERARVRPLSPGLFHYAMNDKGLSDRSPETEIAPAGNCLGRGDFSIIRLSGQPLEHKTLRLRSRRIFPLPYFLSASADGAENSGLSSVPA